MMKPEFPVHSEQRGPLLILVFSVPGDKFVWCIDDMLGAMVDVGQENSLEDAIAAADEACPDPDNYTLPVDAIKALLQSIIDIAGNRTDQQIENINGVHDGMQRAGWYIHAREAARLALRHMRNDRDLVL